MRERQSKNTKRQKRKATRVALRQTRQVAVQSCRSTHAKDRQEGGAAGAGVEPGAGAGAGAEAGVVTC